MTCGEEEASVLDKDQDEDEDTCLSEFNRCCCPYLLTVLELTTQMLM